MTEAVQLAVALEEMGKLRDEADYELGQPGSFTDDAVVNHFRHLARGLIDLLKQIDSAPARRAALIAAIQSVRP
jgi:hypothetical protein